MKKFNYKHLIRRSHRYLGICIGIQFMFWTAGGLYFSWTKIEQVRSEHIRVAAEPVELPVNLFAAHSAPDGHLPSEAEYDMAKLRFVNILGEAHYYLPYSLNNEEHSILIRFSDGEKRAPLDEKNAAEIAKRSINQHLDISSIELIEKGETSKHHEYRGRPLPAYAVNFAGPENYTAYISVADHQVQAVRSNTWRVFDFLWMLHTMDFEGRDNFNNYLLRAFSVFGVVTILSGFLLFFISSKTIRKIFYLRSRGLLAGTRSTRN